MFAPAGRALPTICSKAGILNSSEVLQSFEEVAGLAGGTGIGPIPNAKAAGKPGQPQLHAAAVMFLADFPSQAIVQDLRQLKQRPLENTALECLFRLTDVDIVPPPERPPEAERFSTLEADPSQERAVLSARTSPGLVLQGPPGTGKSQTIVNVIADCLGRDETVLVVCEKQAALEVVHKRLAAEGLDHRVFRVENTVSDRAKILRAIQAQVPALFQRTDLHETSRHGKRRELAARIDQAEADLDAYHRAIYTLHPRLGYAYRDVLSRLSADAARAGDLAAPELRAILGPLEPGKLAMVVGECAGLIDTWLDGDVHRSPLSIFKPVPVDEGLATRVAGNISRWRSHEAERAKAIASYNAASAGHEPIVVSDPKPIADWLHTHTAPLLAVQQDVF